MAKWSVVLFIISFRKLCAFCISISSSIEFTVDTKEIRLGIFSIKPLSIQTADWSGKFYSNPSLDFESTKAMSFMVAPASYYISMIEKLCFLAWRQTSFNKNINFTLHVLARNRDGFLVKLRLGLRLMQSPHVSNMYHNELCPFLVSFVNQRRFTVTHFWVAQAYALDFGLFLAQYFTKAGQMFPQVQKQGYQWPRKNDLCPPIFFFKKSSILVFIFKRKCCRVKNVTSSISSPDGASSLHRKHRENQKINKIRSPFLQNLLSCHPFAFLDTVENVALTWTRLT